MGNKNVQLAANDLKIQHHGILSTFNDTIKSQYTDGFKANRFVISNSRKEPEDRKSTRLNSSHIEESRMPSSA